jgi:hypothetical protein
MKKTLLYTLVAAALVLVAAPALAQRGPCQPTPWNPRGINCNGHYGYSGIYDPYPGTRSGGQDAMNYATAVAIGVPAVIGILGAVRDLFTPEPDVVYMPQEQIAPVAPIAALPVGKYNGDCFWRSYNPTIMNPRYRYGDRRFICVGPYGDYSAQAPPLD